MGLRFRKRIKILPGVYINLSKSGVSTSLGGKGLTVNLRGDKTRTTVGIPSTGISYSSTSTTSDPHATEDQGHLPTGGGIPLWLIFGAVLLLIYFMT